MHFPAPPDVDPAHWSPPAQVVAAYQTADLILLNGVGYARWVERATLPRSRLVDTSAAFRERAVRRQDGVTHAHGPEGAHSHRDLASTTWLDPGLAIEQARAVRDAFARARPERAAAFGAGTDALERDLLDLDARLGAVAEAIGDAPLLFSHPVYQYFARRYGLNARSLHWEPDEAPGEAMWAELAELLEAHPARWLIWESAPLPATARRLEGLGVRSLVFAPCANAPERGDFLVVMRENATALEAAFAPAGGPGSVSRTR